MSNIAEVIGRRFNYQPGMTCKEIDGVLRIVEFPGGIPSQAEQDQWTVEHDALVVGENVRRNALRQDQRFQTILARLEDATPAEIDDFVEAEVTTLAGARTMFKRVLLLLAKK